MHERSGVFAGSLSLLTAVLLLVAGRGYGLDAAASDQFGAAVAVSGDTLVVAGATGDDDAGDQSGSSYVFDGSPDLSCVAPPAGMVAWWTFDETSGTLSTDIVGGNDGTHVNGPVPSAGQVGGSLSFDGVDDYVSVPDSDLWAFGSNEFTIEFWSNFTVPPHGTTGHPGDVFISNDEGPNSLPKWFFALNSSTLDFHTNGCVGCGPFSPNAPFNPQLGRWYHLAVTRSGTDYRIYVDGQLGAAGPNAATIPNPDAILTIGRALEPFGGFMNGRIDEMTVYSRALTIGELQGIVTAGSEGKCSPVPVGLFYVLDGLGGLHPGGSASPIIPAPPYFGFDIARDVELATVGAYVLDGFGGVHAAGGEPALTPGPPYFGFDIAQDLELASGGGAYALDGYGGVHAVGGAPVLSPATPYFGFDAARDLELGGGGYYVLDAWGGLHVGAGATPISPGPPYFGFDISKDLELATGGGYALDGFGGVHALGGAPVLSPATPYFGFDVARDMELAPGGGGHYVLDGFGGLHPGGGAPTVSPSPPYFGFDIAQDLELRAPAAPAGPILESATLGPPEFGGGLTIGSVNDQVLGNRFSVTQRTQITAIGGHLNTFSGGNLLNVGSIWGAIIPMSGPLPSFDLAQVEANALVSAVFQDNDPSSGDLREAVSIVLDPGDYALLFGASGLFGTTGEGLMTTTGQVRLPQFSLFYWDGRPGNDVWRDGGTNQAPRFVVEGFAIQ